MDWLYVILCVTLQVVALVVLREKNSLTAKPGKLALGSGLLVLSAASMAGAYGALAGVFIAFALLSLVGMLVPLVKVRF